MYPWFFNWAPRLQLPFSGSVTQDYKPSTDWLFGSIKAEAGNGAIEKKAFSDVASYGKQLGLITEVLVDIVEQVPPNTTKGSASLDSLKKIQDEIEKVKAVVYATEIDELESKILDIQRRGGPNSELLLSRLRALLSKGVA